MANTLGTTNGVLVAQMVLPTLLAKFPLLTQITRDFSSEAVPLFNQTVTTRVISATTAGEYSTSTGYAATDRTAVDVSVTMDRHPFHTIAVNDQERTSTNRDLLKEFSDTAAHAIGQSLMDNLFSKILAATFDQAYPAGSADFDRADTVAIDKAMADLNIPEEGRFMVLKPAWYAGLKLDTVIVSNQINPASNEISSGVLPDVEGFKISRYSALPDNSENLVGIAGVRDALVMVARIPDYPQDNITLPGNINVVTDDRTGLSLMVREWYDFLLGKQYRTFTLMAGFAAGLSQSGKCRRLIRITSS